MGVTLPLSWTRKDTGHLQLAGWGEGPIVQDLLRCVPLWHLQFLMSQIPQLTVVI